MSTQTSTTNQPTVTIYTDGGCSPNPGLGGYAAVLQTERGGQPVERELSAAVPDVNNQRMELLAAVSALETLKRPCQVTLYADSHYLIKGMTQWLANWLANGWMTSKGKPVKHADLWQRLHAATQTHTVEFRWVKAHAGHAQNERVDALVAQARENYGKQPEQAAKPQTPAQTEPATKPIRLLIAGSRNANANMRRGAELVVKRAMEHGWTIVVGDNPQGVDQAVVELCRQAAYTNVIVVGIAEKPRNGGVANAQYVQIGQSYAERDRLMAQASKRGVFLWDGQSRGTRQVASYMQHDLNKPVHLYNFAGTFA